jgi:predicted dehydrogenase
MSRTYRVLIAGMGKRGLHHASAFSKNPRFEVVAVSDPVPAQLEKAKAAHPKARAGGDAAALAKETKPDIFCFCTPPHIRLPLIKTGLESGAGLIAYEKPMSMSMSEAIEIRKLVQQAGVKTVVSHQHRYGPHYRAVHDLVRSGAIGRVHTVYGTAVGWLMHLITHLIDYMRGYTGNADVDWVMAQASGRGKLADNHPSPDYIAGVLHFTNGVRGWIECGAGAPDVPEVDYWWRKNRVGAQGTEGFAEALTGGGWRAITKDGPKSGGGTMDYEQDMAPYVADMAAWLDDPAKVHPCDGEQAYKGIEITMALIRSVVERCQVKLPLGPGEPEVELLKKALPDRPVLLSIEGSRKEYPK